MCLSCFNEQHVNLRRVGDDTKIFTLFIWVYLSFNSGWAEGGRYVYTVSWFSGGYVC